MPGSATVACHDGDVVFAVLVEVRLRPGIADPQGATIERSLPTLGFSGIGDVSVGKAIRFTLEARDEERARQQVDELCQRFLINPVIEEAMVTVSALAGEARSGEARAS
jgi:phosphoribosylformylglycinamidine synthase subunit PurS